MRRQARRHAPRRNRMTDLAHLMFAIDVHQVDGELHEEGVDRFARHDPQSRAGIEMRVLEESGAALLAGVGEIDRVAQHCAAGLIAHQDFQTLEL